MLKTIINIILIFSLVNNQQIQFNKSCTCGQLLIQADCGKNNQCQWETIKQLCNLQSVTPSNENFVQYCDKFADAINCAQANSCLWNDNKCTFFTGCTAYTYGTNQECQALSTRCISDGVHCVEFNICSAYKTQQACSINSNGKYCYWNVNDTTKPKCEEADDCSKLPVILQTDNLCRAQIAKCTASSNGGCIESGMKCKDQIAEVSCVTNYDKTQQCFWNQGKCYDKTCDNALIQLNTDKACKDFLSSCTVKQGGGCITRTTCQSAIQTACVTDNTGSDCFWNGSQCLLKTCNNALKDNTTNLSCQQYLSKCITNGSGCVDNTGCESAIIKEACDKTLTGQLCNWDGNACKPKTCLNAGSNYIGHDQCTAYLSTCTSNGANGCIDRTCDNAPNNNITNDQCEQYLVNSNCITKNGGGCRVNSQCEKIDIDIACIKDINGQNCFWNNGSCKSKTCQNSLVDNNTHELCQSFSPSCTVDSKGKCVDKICEHVLNQENCTNDLNQQKCIYVRKCYKKQCTFAQNSITTHEQCQSYLKSCTLDNSGQGCMIIPQKCENITNSDSCKIKADGSNCQWIIGKCVDDTCEAAPINGTLNTNQLCDQYKTSCVVNNNLNGCMQLPEQCQNRKQSENCTVEQSKGLNPKCQWDNLTNSSSPVCIDISCQNANLVSLKNNVTLDGCWDYFSLNCVLAKNGETSVCIPRPKSCVGLIQETCQKSQVLIGDQSCYWDNGSNSCKVIECSSVTFANGTVINHDACYGAMNQCTVDAVEGTQCIPLMSCNQYLFSDQCKLDQSGQSCTWRNGVCQVYSTKPCEDPSDSDQYDTNEECQTYSPKCGLNSKKCSLKQTTCASYLDQSQCEMNVLNGKQKCAWSNGACSNKTGTFDCTTITGVGLTGRYCMQFNYKCSANASGTSCIAGQLNCSNYSEADCKFGLAYQYCKFQNNKCIYDCSMIPGPYDDISCQLQTSYACGVKSDRTGCMNVPTQCSDNTVENCFLAVNGSINDFCYPLNGVCVSSKENPLVASNCGTIEGIFRDYNYCSYISQGKCSVNAQKTLCIQKLALCSDYLQYDACTYSKDGQCFWTASGKCIKYNLAQCTDHSGTSQEQCQQQLSTCGWSSGSTCELKCENIQGPQTIKSCQIIDTNCTVNQTGQGCVNISDTCENANQTNCTSSKGSNYCYWLNNSCISSNIQPLTSSNCNQISALYLDLFYCLNISQSKCILNSLQTNCVELRPKCSDYNSNLSDCFFSSEQQCVIDSTGSQCVKLVSGSRCETIKIYGKISNYLDFHCNQILSYCKANQEGTGCEYNINCGQYTGVNLNYSYCVDKILGCSVNAQKTACVIAKETCAEYSVINCGYALEEGECIVQNNACVQNQCDNAPTNIIDMNGCQTYSTNCIKKIGGCENITVCQKNSTSTSCQTNPDCLWNSIVGQCFGKSCFAAESSTSYDTHIECQTVGNCTVKAKADKTVGQGCIPLAACNNYQNQEQCKIDNNGNTCYWVTQDQTKQFCSERSCLTAPTSLNTHQNCLDYMTGCTVYINGDKLPQGCTPLKKCNEYAYQSQCYISSEIDQNNNNINCGWNGTICTYRSCETAEKIQNDHSKCSQYYEGCTVNATDDGCVTIPDKCESMTKNQCFDGSIDQNNRKCIWFDDSNQCVTKTCETSPNFQNENECEAYLPECTTDTQKCKTLNCQYFSFTTDDQCKLALPICTTDGTTCVKRESCEQAKAEAGCINDSDGQLCQWITIQQKSYCTNRTCENAPLTLKTESECQSYYTPVKGTCTTKKNGGCITKSTCIAANIQSACTKDNSGVVCIWDNWTQLCRYKECQDYFGQTHSVCNKQNSLCTVGLNNKCAKIVNCEQTKIQAACIEGKNGPCLWISKYINDDGSTGACFLYESCKSLDWKTDQECKLISPNCTTNGLECISITNCDESNTDGGCKTGTDGNCIKTVSIKGANDKVCKKYISCDQAYYLTHNECFEANSNCTSDYVNGCIALNSCSSYTKQGQCVLNKVGLIQDSNGSILSTGQCIWESVISQCRDKQCKDIIKMNDADCSAELITCTSDAITCISKGTCNSYTTQNACSFAKGTDGVCYWVNANGTHQAYCRIKTCADIQNGTSINTCSQLPNCVSDGTNCVNKGLCSSYKTQDSCMATGLDGLCVWSDATAPKALGNCSFMNGCASAKDETTCKQAQNRCNWNSLSKICAAHTCQSYQIQTKYCSYYYTWDMQKFNVCSLKDGKCVSTDLVNLSEGDCYVQSGYQYSWNPKSQKCLECGISIPNSNNSGNNNDASGWMFRLEKLLIIFILWWI